MPIQILLVDDNPGDVRLMREVLLGVNNSVHLLVASDGVEAMAFLNRERQYAVSYTHLTLPTTPYV